MAERPIYLPSTNFHLWVKKVDVNFVWHPGMSASQKKKNVIALHQAAKAKGIAKNTLEVSSKSSLEIGVLLSAFNLEIVTKKYGHRFSVESAFQASKKFQLGGPYKDLLSASPREAKRDSRLKESGELVSFEFFGDSWELEPKTAFYDWLYINALNEKPALAEQLDDFDSFTDIEFNPKKSINCQAHSVALFQSLRGQGLLNDALANKETFLEIIKNKPSNHSGVSQQSLF